MASSPPGLRYEDMSWDDAKIFLALARTGTLSAAAQKMGCGIATISRRIERLETALGLPLFLRHQTGYQLSDEGKDLLVKAEILEDAAHSFHAQALSQTQSPHKAQGHVRLATAENFAHFVIIPALPYLLAAHPGLEIELLSNVSLVNLHKREADLALRTVPPARGHVTGRRLGSLSFGLYAAPTYIAHRKAGTKAENFHQDRFITWSSEQSHFPGARWITDILEGRPPVLACNMLSSQIHAVKAGLGLAILPHFLGEAEALVPIEIPLEIEQPIWLVVHTDLLQTYRVRVVADFLAKILREKRFSRQL